MLTKVQIIAELTQRFVAGGNRSNELEFFQDEVFPLIDSYAVSTFSVAMNKMANPQEAINNQFLKNLCFTVDLTCACEGGGYIYNIPPIELSDNRGQMPKIMSLPMDLGIFDIVLNDCFKPPIRQTTQAYDRTNVRIAALMGVRWKVVGNTITLSNLVDGVIRYVPSIYDLEDNDIMPLLPAAEITLWDYLQERYQNWGLLPKDYKTDSQDTKSQTLQ